MRGSPSYANMGSVQGSEVKATKKAHLGGMLNPEEARMNRALLKEIARVKRGDEPSGLLQR